MSTRTGPPDDKERPNGSHTARPDLKKLADTTTNHAQSIAAARHYGRAGELYRHGFAHGFADALRLAARRLPPECWSVLDDLASDYDLAGCHG